ncbi:uncharacterized protein LOC133149984 isoform X2 [Syngnathus typhle]|uniref:uncharacterized protein LOC133149984 isoform X2 n=2 Tax=Syngnathus typhle TaxID=161592 RepID=UPI002A6A6A7B|nr:uncharacterized protein LOC133149984 isoform X2 [Syngnathus typhle]
MGCHLTRTKARQPTHHRHQNEQQDFVELQLTNMQVEGKMGWSHRRKRIAYTSHSERHWEALRNIGLMEVKEGRGSSNSGRIYDKMYTGNDNLLMSPDIFPTNGYLSRGSRTQHHTTNYLPSVSYSLDHLDRLDDQAPEMAACQPKSESCLLGCYNTGKMENKIFSRQVFLPSHYRPAWRPLGYIPLNELDSRLGCSPDSPHHRVPLSEAETDAMSSLPGNTPSSQGSSSSSESLISSEPSDSGFHSVSTGENRCLPKIHRHAHHLRLGHSPHEQRSRWDLESIPETMPLSHTGAQQSSRCTMAKSTTSKVHIHRGERSPTLHRNRSPTSSSSGCRTEPCQRRALWLEQRQARGSHRIEGAGRSQTVMDLSKAQRRCSTIHPMNIESNLVTEQVHSSQPHPTNNMLFLSSRAHYHSRFSMDRTSLISHPNTTRSGQSAEGCREEDSRSHGLVSCGGPTDWRAFQTLGNQTRIQKASAAPYYNTLRAHWNPCSPPYPHCHQSNQKSVRNQLLRARAYRLAKERSEVTTDEEECGELDQLGGHLRVDGSWAGRYCNRAERRRHLFLSRQHREGRNEEAAVGGGQSSLSSQMVLELSHRKQNRLRNSKLLDDWTTVEELLTHGTRMEVDSQLCPSPLLSVTTV